MTTKALGELRKRELTPHEDHVLERWAESCSRSNGCDKCPDVATCERLSNKLVNRVSRFTERC